MDSPETILPIFLLKNATMLRNEYREEQVNEFLDKIIVVAYFFFNWRNILLTDY